mmetsp:Transcript_4147/g.5621  ORF Transcript_4147/g.5621 Transcript_4147/m.5621 type:complete len:193 (-) Transcript_4147:603-1181(-)|eukprot:CAMPEP_0185725924 /NCGR_PEP_ID=MMETSP1171-20130828/2051_1 /TAXON_ID=374046 /ORGANISM="Helicotheca tamensis, Strain CCMP826" /LENGTH=192 /DNA_ID=CAMNT_0028394167 /DNA_START=31 /DNA_END=609 /DNA_ORIENTATION=-
MTLTRYAQKYPIFLSLAALLLILAVISTQIPSSSGAKKVEYDKPGDCAVSDVRVITSEELNKKKGDNEGEVWVSVLGEIFDVSTGRHHYVGSSYSVFAGSDSSAAFTTGDFSEKGGKKSLDEIEDKELGGIESWRKFYHEHETYEFIGVLEGIYYDKDGKPTDDLKNLRVRIESAKKKRGELKKDKKKKDKK